MYGFLQYYRASQVKTFIIICKGTDLFQRQEGEQSIKKAITYPRLTVYNSNHLNDATIQAFKLQNTSRNIWNAALHNKSLNSVTRISKSTNGWVNAIRLYIGLCAITHSIVSLLLTKCKLYSDINMQYVYEQH